MRHQQNLMHLELWVKMKQAAQYSASVQKKYCYEIPGKRDLLVNIVTISDLKEKEETEICPYEVSAGRQAKLTYLTESWQSTRFAC